MPYFLLNLFKNFRNKSFFPEWNGKKFPGEISPRALLHQHHCMIIKLKACVNGFLTQINANHRPFWKAPPCTESIVAQRSEFASSSGTTHQIRILHLNCFHQILLSRTKIIDSLPGVFRAFFPSKLKILAELRTKTPLF